MIRTFFLIFILFLLSSCNNGIRQNFLGNYYLVAPDIDEQTSLSYHETSDGSAYGDVIKATVFAVGYNSKYIIAKQHPYGDKHITNYFILPVKNGFNWKNNNGLMGPLTINEFNQKQIELNIKPIQFTIIYKDLE
jgi:hypothetical protein